MQQQKDVINPTDKMPKSPIDKYFATFIKSYRHAMHINGTAIIKEKSAAAFLDTPTKRLPAIVLPLLENPGHRERH